MVATFTHKYDLIFKFKLTIPNIRVLRGTRNKYFIGRNEMNAVESKQKIEIMLENDRQ